MKRLVLIISILYLLSKSFRGEISERPSDLRGFYHEGLAVYFPMQTESFPVNLPMETDLMIAGSPEGLIDVTEALDSMDNSEESLGIVSSEGWFHRKAPPAPQRRKKYNWVPKRVTVSHIQGNQNKIAYGTNFTTVGLLFAPTYTIDDFLPMLDLRGHRFDDNTYASNIGLIARYIPDPDSFCQIYGANLYYDYRQGGIGYFQQIGIGAEVLGRRWDFRGNAYVPFGRKKKVKVCLFEEDEFVMIESFLEDVSYSFNAEVGYLAVNSRNFFLYAAAGPYYIVGRDCFNTIAGGKVRIRPQYRDCFAIDLSVSHDSFFKTIFQAEFIIYLPFYQIANQNKKPCGITDRQIYQPVERFEVMPLMRQNCWNSNF